MTTEHDLRTRGLNPVVFVDENGNYVTFSLVAGSAIIGKVDHTTTGIGHGHKEVASAGTAIVLAGSTAAKWVTLQAYRANTANIAVGGSGVVATVTIGTGTGVTLAPGETITLPVDNLADVFIDATTTGDGVRYTYGS